MLELESHHHQAGRKSLLTKKATRATYTFSQYDNKPQQGTIGRQRSTIAVDTSRSEKKERLHQFMKKPRSVRQTKSNNSSRKEESDVDELVQIIVKSTLALVAMLLLLYLPISHELLVSLGRGLLTLIMFTACVAFMVLVNLAFMLEEQHH